MPGLEDLTRFLRPGGLLAVATPGMTREIREATLLTARKVT